ncbi:MAG: hypothetical protein ACE5FD_05430 [Anaerolineae bacterium]
MNRNVIITFVLGALFGLVVLGWYVFPLQWTGGGPKDMAPAEQEFYIRAISELYSRDLDVAKVQTALGDWNSDEIACRMAATTTDPADAARLEAVAGIINGRGCATTTTAETPADETGSNSSLGQLIVIVLVLFFLGGAILVVLNRRRSLTGSDSGGQTRYTNVPEAAPVTADEGVMATPLARFQTTYNFGHDSYDDSFSIENINGEFMGECGVGISESIGSDLPKNVTAFEVWLFDKNDIRTVTKVVMSDHAFFDEALKAKLAPKGEPVLSRENETIVLETASLIINAEIKAMEYGTGTLPPQSFFERMTFELSAWAKEVDVPEPDIEGRVDELLNY